MYVQHFSPPLTSSSKFVHPDPCPSTVELSHKSGEFRITLESGRRRSGSGGNGGGTRCTGKTGLEIHVDLIEYRTDHLFSLFVLIRVLVEHIVQPNTNMFTNAHTHTHTHTHLSR
jgi:hypothetical protein